MNDTFISATWTKNHTMLSPTMFPPKPSTADTGLSLTFSKLTLQSDSAVQISGKHRGRLAGWWIQTPLLQATDELHLQSHTEVTLSTPGWNKQVPQWNTTGNTQGEVTHPYTTVPRCSGDRCHVLMTIAWTNGLLPSVATLVAFKKNSTSKMTWLTTRAEHRAQWKQPANC